MIKMEEKEQPLHKQMVEAISTLGISKLVVSMAFMKASSSKSRSAISGTFYVVRHKPDWCELFVICDGQRIFLREELEGCVINEGGMMLKDRNHSLRNWLGRMFPETSASSSSPNSPSSRENCSQEMEQYAHELLSLHQMDGGNVVWTETSTQLAIIVENLDGAERIEVLKSRIQDARDTIQLNRKQANAAKERRRKAERAISICNAKVKLP